ncbi:MAG: glycosyltransferase [Planctomycetes bacterium]|nr:glycosyltransferase [Planctomycetota bacterium]
MPNQKLNLLLGLWNAPYLLGAYYYRAIKDHANATTVGPAFHETQSDFELSPGQPIQPVIDQLPTKCDFYVHFYSKPDIFPPDLHKLSIPKAWYVYDTHLHLEELAACAYLFDIVFCTDEMTKSKLHQLGVPCVEILPFAAEEALYYREQNGVQERKYDIGFAGSVKGHPTLRHREELLKRLSEKFNVRVEDKTLLGGEVADFFQDCSLVLNHAVKDDINMRISETMMSGRPLLTPQVTGIETYIKANKHACIYDENSLESDIRHLLEKPEEAEAMALRGQKLALEKHNYAVYGQKMLKHLEEELHKYAHGGRPHKSPYLVKAAQFRYHYFRYPGDAFQWLKGILCEKKSSSVSQLAKLMLSGLIVIMKLLEKLGKGPYFQEAVK